MPKISDLLPVTTVRPNDLFALVDTLTVPTTKKVTAAVLAQIAPVQSVAGRTGEVTIAASDVSGLADVATSGSASDLASGTLPVDRLPAATITTRGAVIVGSGLSVSSGTLSAAVTSVAGKTGAVTLALADVSGTSTLIPSDVTGVIGASAITNIVALSQSAYDALSSRSASTLYVIS